ncbi:MAG: hypothetical protein AMXMBFR83_18830 [Phycisphaerae bacterium]
MAGAGALGGGRVWAVDRGLRGGAGGGAPPPASRPADTQPAPSPATQPAAGKPKPGPKYFVLRYDDDFSYLDGPEGSYEPDFFDPIKRIHIGDDVTLRLGGEIRGRLESLTHKRYGLNEGRGRTRFPTQDTYFVHRYYYHADVEYRKLLRVFVEGISAWGEDIDKSPMPPFEDRFDAHQLFADLRFLGEEVPLTLRVGRQELNYGRQRLLGILDWANVRRTWDAVKVFWNDPAWSADVFYARPVDFFNKRPDRYDEDVHLYGWYNTYKGIRDHGIDAYFFALRNSGRFTNANFRRGDVGDLSLYTAGSRFWGKRPVGAHLWDYDTELAGQWGKASGDTIQAWMWSADTGYALSNLPWKPRIGVGLDYASGDDDPFDDIHGTFNQLFPTPHAYLGLVDQVGRQNIWSQNVNLTLKPHERVTTQLTWLTFWLDKNTDALYGVTGLPVRRSVRGGVGTEVGHELDWTLTWEIDRHATLLLGYSHMWTSGFFNRRNGPDEEPDLFYVQYSYKF